MLLWQFLKTEFRGTLNQIGNDNEECRGMTSSSGTRAPNATTRNVFRSTTPLSQDDSVPVLKLRKVSMQDRLEERLKNALTKYNLDLDIDELEPDPRLGARWCQAAGEMSGRPIKNEKDQQAHTALGSGLAATLIAEQGQIDPNSEYRFHLLTPYHPNIFSLSRQLKLFQTAFDRSLKTQFGSRIPQRCRKGQRVPSTSSGEPDHLALYAPFRDQLWGGYQGRLLKGTVPLPYGSYEGIFGVEEKTESALSSCLLELEAWWQLEEETLDLIMVLEEDEETEHKPKKGTKKKEKIEQFRIIKDKGCYSTKFAHMMAQIWEEMVTYRYGVTVITCRSRSFIAFLSDYGEMSISPIFEHHLDPAIHHHPNEDISDDHLTLAQKVDVVWYQRSLLTLILAVAVWAKEREIEQGGTELKGWPESWPPARDL